MNINDKVKKIPFLSNRIIVDQNDADQAVSVIGYRDTTDSPYSTIVSAPESRSGVLKPCIMICSDGMMVKYDGGTQTISINVPKMNNKEGFNQEFPASIDEGEFFQDTLINNYHHITYDFIVATRDILAILDESK